MQAKLEREYYLRASDFDCNGKIRISAVLELFQDIAGAHAAMLGCSGEEMQKRGLLWVLVGVRLQILKQPKEHSVVKILTWPLEQKGIRFVRDYKVFDENGELIILGSSKWAFIDIAERKLARVSDIYPSELDYCTDKSFEADEKIPTFSEADATYTVVPQFSHLDTNNHVNNTKYADFIMDSLGSVSQSVIAAQIDYKSEVLYKEPLTIAYKNEQNATLFKGTDENGQTKFIAKFTWN